MFQSRLMYSTDVLRLFIIDSGSGRILFPHLFPANPESIRKQKNIQDDVPIDSVWGIEECFQGQDIYN